MLLTVNEPAGTNATHGFEYLALRFAFAPILKIHVRIKPPRGCYPSLTWFPDYDLLKFFGIAAGLRAIRLVISFLALLTLPIESM